MKVVELRRFGYTNRPKCNKGLIKKTGVNMREELRAKIINICNNKIDDKGGNVGVSFYAFFANKNNNPESLMEVATWWIQTHQLDHFVKATKIKTMVQNNL